MLVPSECHLQKDTLFQSGANHKSSKKLAHIKKNIQINIRTVRHDERGASAVEFALVLFPFLILCLGVLQFVFLNYTQQTLSDALYSSASNPESELISGDRSGYRARVCAKMPFQTDCLNLLTGIKIEMMRLDALPTATTAITGSDFLPGASGDVLVLRATMPAPQVVAFIPQLTAKDSVIFRRP
ncbi:TadE family protein [Methylobacterium sp. WL9]|uniref:TadE/TadG family type IV pilus assembly protein n=1 Tax=Methylobacterium sp. WL9 TaxID=2603898 RepID=UPI0011C9FA3D|nr:TadE family protein [Methylobacterium sp. WL9]TXN21372.1 pilus assembly protein [Methylobacterium sp. WL9]